MTPAQIAALSDRELEAEYERVTAECLAALHALNAQQTLKSALFRERARRMARPVA